MSPSLANEKTGFLWFILFCALAALLPISAVMTYLLTENAMSAFAAMLLTAFAVLPVFYD